MESLLPLGRVQTLLESIHGEDSILRRTVNFLEEGGQEGKSERRGRNKSVKRILLNVRVLGQHAQRFEVLLALNVRLPLVLLGLWFSFAHHLVRWFFDAVWLQLRIHILDGLFLQVLHVLRRRSDLWSADVPVCVRGLVRLHSTRLATGISHKF